jgi:hypothetical protein
MAALQKTRADIHSANLSGNSNLITEPDGNGTRAGAGFETAPREAE